MKCLICKAGDTKVGTASFALEREGVLCVVVQSEEQALALLDWVVRTR